MNLKKITAIMIGAVMAVSMAVPAMADDKVQPVPWVFGLSIRFPENQRPFPSLQSRSFASFNLCPPLQRTAQ